MGSVNGHAGRAQVNLLAEGRSATRHGLAVSVPLDMILSVCVFELSSLLLCLFLSVSM